MKTLHSSMNFLRKLSLIGVSALVLGATSSCKVQKKMGSSSLSKDFIDGQLRSAVAHYKVLMENAPDDAFPRTWEDNKLQTSGSGGWISGFYPGTLLYLYEFSDEPALLEAAREKLALLEKEKDNTGTHDLGFMLYCSFGNAYRLTGDEAYREILLTGAESLSARFNPAVGCIRSWGKIDDKKEFLVIIDNMMNLELLTWASRQNGNDKYKDIAIAHANTTLENHFRTDNSSWHVINYDGTAGGVIEKRTAQGNADSSAWARGQAWGLYGYTMLGRETRNKKYLEQARLIADFILGNENMPEDGIPYWDFDAPGIPGAKRDASAGAIIASALLELSKLSNGTQAGSYRQAAEKILKSLSGPDYMAGEDEVGGFILKHSVGSLPADSEVDVPLSYADYYYVEALMRYREWFQ